MSDLPVPDEQPSAVEPTPLEPPVEPPAEPPSEPPAAPPKGAASWRSWAIAGAACGVVVVAGIFLTRDNGDGSTDGSVQAGAVLPGGGGPTQQAFGQRGAQGEITGIDGSTITLAATDPGSSDTTEVEVKTSKDTTFTDTVDGTRSDLHEGDNVMVRSADSDDDGSDGTMTAASITDNGDRDLADGVFGGGPGTFRTGEAPDGAMVFPEGAAPPEGRALPDGQVPDGGTRILSRIAAGEITEVDGDQITVKPVQGDEIVVTLTSDTEIHVTKEIGLDDLDKGDDVRVIGERDGDTVTATAVRRGDDGAFVFEGGPRRRQSDAGTSSS